MSKTCKGSLATTKFKVFYEMKLLHYSVTNKIEESSYIGNAKDLALVVLSERRERLAEREPALIGCSSS